MKNVKTRVQKKVYEQVRKFAGTPLASRFNNQFRLRVGVQVLDQIREQVMLNEKP